MNVAEKVKWQRPQMMIMIRFQPLCQRPEGKITGDREILQPLSNQLGIQILMSRTCSVELEIDSLSTLSLSPL